MITSKSLVESDDALADALRPVILKLGRQMRREAQKVGMSILDTQLMALVSKKPGIGICELAALEQVSRPSMSVHIKRLVTDGWLQREAPSDGDQRRTSLTLTPKARRLMVTIRQKRNDWLAAHIAQLTSEERAALAAAIEPMDRLADGRP